MTKTASGETVGTVNCPVCGKPIEIKKSLKPKNPKRTSLHGTCANLDCKTRIMIPMNLLKVIASKGKESLGMSGPEPVAVSPPTPPDNHVPILPEPAAPQAAPIKTLPVAEPKAAEVMPKEVIVAPPPPPAPVIPAPDKTPSLFKTKKKEEPDNAPVAPAPVKSPTLFKIKKKEEQDDDRKDG